MSRETERGREVGLRSWLPVEEEHPMETHGSKFKARGLQERRKVFYLECNRVMLGGTQCVENTEGAVREVVPQGMSQFQ